MISSNNINKLKTAEDFIYNTEQLFLQADLFFGHGTDNAWDEAVLVLMHVLKLPDIIDIDLTKRKLTEFEIQELSELVNKRINTRKPLAYLTNTAWFMGEKYYVNEQVIVPRSPLAELIGNEFQPWLGSQKITRILDLCTGSGCLAIACSKIFPAVKIDAIDISEPALKVAAKNISLHNCIERVNLIKSDLFNNLDNNLKNKNKKYNIIISNPPYVAAEEMLELPDEFLHEPEISLVSGYKGLDITTRILQQAEDFLAPGGLLFIEVGNAADDLQKKYSKLPFIWLEFTHGGSGVFLLHKEDL